MITKLLRAALATCCLAALFACGGGGGGAGGAIAGAGAASGTAALTTGSTETGGPGATDASSGGSGSPGGSTSTAAAEGSGDGSGVGSGGTGATADAVGIGSVDGLGSVFLNGLRYNTDTAQFSVEDAPRIELGMSAKVTGPVSADFTAGTATRVESAAELRGPVSSIDTAAGTFVVMGTTVSTDPATVWADGSGLAAVPAGATVQVWGLPGAPGTLRATRVAQVSSSGAIVTGVVENANPLLRTFTIGTLTVNYAAATLLPGLDAGALTNGVLVRVRASGTSGTPQLVAASVQRWYAVPEAGAVGAQLAGIVTSFVGLQRFQLLGVVIDASAAQITGGPRASVGNGVKVEVAGILSGGVLRATKLKIRHVPGTGGPSSFVLDGTVGAFASPASFRVRGQPVDASAPTVVFVNGSAASLGNGVKLSVTGSQVRDGVLLADRIVFD
ncbi:MAG: DUF5666 domain-containing protein [Variovorax sp.]